VRDGKREEAPSKFVRSMKKGETFRAEMAGSGGYGDPLERDALAVAEDVLQEKISIANAAEDYGVVVDEAFSLDEAATASLRRDRAAG